MIGKAANLNDPITNGLERAAKLLGMTVAEVRNRVTVTVTVTVTVNGAIEIGRAPGVTQVTFRAPVPAGRSRPGRLRARELLPLTRGHAKRAAGRKSIRHRSKGAHVCL